MTAIFLMASMAGSQGEENVHYALRCDAAKRAQARNAHTKDATRFGAVRAPDFLEKIRRMRVFCSEQRSSGKLSSTEPLSEIFTSTVDFNNK
jgi:hypothetical protein